MPKQSSEKTKVSKGRVWTVFAVGAAGVFGGAVAAERLEQFFPAISKANKAMEASRKAAAEAERKEAIEAATARGAADGSLADAVSEGIAEASRRAKEQQQQLNEK